MGPAIARHSNILEVYSQFKWNRRRERERETHGTYNTPVTCLIVNYFIVGVIVWHGNSIEWFLMLLECFVCLSVHAGSALKVLWSQCIRGSDTIERVAGPVRSTCIHTIYTYSNPEKQYLCFSDLSTYSHTYSNVLNVWIIEVEYNNVVEMNRVKRVSTFHRRAYFTVANRMDVELS